MAKKITVAVEIEDNRLAKELLDHINELPEVETHQWFSGMGEKGPLSVKTTPDIIVIDDQPGSPQSVIGRLSRIRQMFAQAALFVVSADKRPEHIVDVMKSGAAQFLVTPVNPKVLLDAIEEVRTKLANSGKIAKGSVYSFISSKGGLGSTVIAVNTAVALARGKGISVALCDMSFQSGDASVLLDLMPQTTIFDICQNFHRLDVSLLRGSMAKHQSGVDFLAAPKNPEDSDDITASHISRILDLARKLYDHIIVDCTSMHVDDRSMEIFKSSDKVFVVTDLSVPAVRNTVRICQLLQKMGLDTKKVEVVVNRYLKGGTLSIEEVEKTLKRRICWLFPNDFSDIVTSINRGTPLVKNSPNSPFSRNTVEFAEKLVNPCADQSYRGIRGTFGKSI